MSKSPQWVIGNEVLLKTSAGEEVTATLFGYDPESGVLLLKEAGMHNGVANLRYLRTSNVAQLLKSTPPTAPFDTQLPPIDMTKCHKREEKALQQAEREASRIGVGVSKQSQAIFEALCKTLPCHWEDKNIIVLDEVIVSEPYLPSSCSARTPKDQDTLERVKLVLTAERQRLGMGQE